MKKHWETIEIILDAPRKSALNLHQVATKISSKINSHLESAFTVGTTRHGYFLFRSASNVDITKMENFLVKKNINYENIGGELRLNFMGGNKLDSALDNLATDIMPESTFS